MALTKKLAKEIAELINEVTVANIMSQSAVDKGNLTSVHSWRTRHDEAATKLNNVLGVRAVVLYYP